MFYLKAGNAVRVYAAPAVVIIRIARFTYIELGDGDELWENRSMKQIIEAHGDVFSLLSRLQISDQKTRNAPKR